EIRGEGSLQMAGIQDDEMVQTVSADRSDEPGGSAFRKCSRDARPVRTDRHYDSSRDRLQRAARARIYGILLDAKQFSAFTKRHGGTRITGRRCFPAVRWEDRGAECGTGNESEDRTSMASRGVARWRLFNRPIRTKRAGFGHAHCFRSCRLSA